ncbi:MAG TPA: hypothetical protein VJQ57_10855 [Acidimicrobiia bacterium]|nr:hypothetical protein [Acidimicrobiia bacterium]
MAQPWAVDGHLSFSSNQGSMAYNLQPVPIDFRLVIESVSLVSGQSGIPDREALSGVRLLFMTNNQIISWPIPVVANLRNRTAFEGPGWVLTATRYSATASVRLYADPGSFLQLYAWRTTYINPYSVDFALSGYLLDPASPRLSP